MTYYVLPLFSFVGIVRDIRPVPAAVRNEARLEPLNGARLNAAPAEPRAPGSYHRGMTSAGSRL